MLQIATPFSNSVWDCEGAGAAAKGDPTKSKATTAGKKDEDVRMIAPSLGEDSVRNVSSKNVERRRFMRSFGGTDVTAMCKPRWSKNGFKASGVAYWLMAPEGDRDKNEDDHDGAVAHPLWYSVPHPEPPFICSE